MKSRKLPENRIVELQSFFDRLAKATVLNKFMQQKVLGIKALLGYKSEKISAAIRLVLNKKIINELKSSPKIYNSQNSTEILYQLVNYNESQDGPDNSEALIKFLGKADSYCSLRSRSRVYPID